MRAQLLAHYGSSERAPLLRALCELSSAAKVGSDASHVSRRVPGVSAARIGVELGEIQADASKEVDALPWRDVVDRVDALETSGRHRGMLELMDRVLQTIADARSVAAEMGSAIARVLRFVQSLFASALPESVSQLLGEIGGYLASAVAAVGSTVARLVYDFVNGVRRALVAVFWRVHMALMAGLQIVYEAHESIREAVDRHCFFTLGMYHERGEAAVRGDERAFLALDSEWRRTMAGQLRNMADDAAQLKPDFDNVNWTPYAPTVVETVRVLGTSFVKWIFGKAAFFAAYVVEHLASSMALLFEMFACLAPLAFSAFKPILLILQRNTKPEYEQRLERLFEMPYYKTMLPLAPGATPDQLLESLDKLRTSPDAPDEAKHIAGMGYRALRQSMQFMDAIAQATSAPPPQLKPYEASTKQMEMARLFAKLSAGAAAGAEDEALMRQIMAFAKRYGSRQIDRGRATRLFEECLGFARQCFQDAYDFTLATALGATPSMETIGEPWPAAKYSDPTTSIAKVKDRFPGLYDKDGPSYDQRAKWPSQVEIFDATAVLQIEFNKLMTSVEDDIANTSVTKIAGASTRDPKDIAASALDAIQKITMQRIQEMERSLSENAITTQGTDRARASLLINSLRNTIHSEEVRKAVLIYTQSGLVENMAQLQFIVSKLTILTAASNVLSNKARATAWVVHGFLFLVLAGIVGYGYYLTQCDWNADPTAAMAIVKDSAARIAMAEDAVPADAGVLGWIAHQIGWTAASARSSVNSIAGEGADRVAEHFTPFRNFFQELRPWALIRDVVMLGGTGTMAGRGMVENLSHSIFSSAMLQAQVLAAVFVTVWMTADVMTFGVISLLSYKWTSLESYESYTMRTGGRVTQRLRASAELSGLTLVHNLATLWGAMMARDKLAAGLVAGPVIWAYRSFAPPILTRGVDAALGSVTAAAPSGPGLTEMILQKVGPQPWVQRSAFDLPGDDLKNLRYPKLGDVTRIMNEIAAERWKPRIRVSIAAADGAAITTLLESSTKVYEKPEAMLQYILLPADRESIKSSGAIALPQPPPSFSSSSSSQVRVTEVDSDDEENMMVIAPPPPLRRRGREGSLANDNNSRTPSIPAALPGETYMGIDNGEHLFRNSSGNFRFVPV